MPSRIPIATYRLQLSAGFTFDDAAKLVPYLKSLGVTSMTSGLDRGMFAIRFEFGYGPPFPNLGSRGAAMFQQQIVENRTFDLKCFCLAGEAAIAKNQLQSFAGIAQVKLGAKLLGESRCFESCQHAHFLEEPAIVGQ